MPDDPNQIAGAFVKITADLSDLAGQIDAGVAQVQAGAQQMATAFDVAMAQASAGTEGLNASVASMNAALTSLANNPAVVDLDAELRALQATGLTAQEAAVLLAQSYAQVAQSAGTATPSIAALSAAVQSTGASMNTAAAAAKNTTAATEETSISLGNLRSNYYLVAIAIAVVEKSIVAALEVAGKWERVNEALVATTQDVQGAADAMREIPALADSIGVSIESAQQGFVRFARYGLDLKVIPEVLRDISSGAMASGTAFDTVANSWERAVNTGVIMTRTVQNMGLNMQEIGVVMGMVGRTSAEISAAFKGIETSLNGTSAEMQRATILMAALPDRVKNLSTSVDDTTKSFTQLKNAVTESMDKIGTALEKVGEGGGLTAIKIVIDTIATAVLGLVTVFGELSKTIDAVANVLIDAFVAIGNAMADALTGNFKKAAADLQAGGQKMVADWMKISGEMAGEFTSTGKALNDMWGTATATATTSTAAIGTAATNMGQQVAQGAQAASDGTKTLAEAMVYLGDTTAKTTESMVSNFQQIGTVANQALTNAVTQFDKMAAAFFSGVGSATEYTKALTALDKEQRDVSAGIENQKTAMLLVANTYREMGLAVTNANISLKATVADMANGIASATQYSAALKALNKAQEDLNGGFQNAHTIALLVADDYRTLGVSLANAETKLQAVYNAFLRHKASLGELESAIAAADKAQQSFNNGLETYATALIKVSTKYYDVQVAAKNAETALLAANDAFLKGKGGIDQVSAAVDDYVKKTTAANGGIETWQAAELKILDTHTKLDNALQNANTDLAKATGLLHSGAIGWQEYETYVQAAKRAHDAVYGAQQASTQAVSQLTLALEAYTQAQIRANNAGQAAQSVGYELRTQQLDLETALRQANIQLEEATRQFNEGSIGSALLERATQAVDTALKNLGVTTNGMTDDMRKAVTELTDAASAMDKLGSAATKTGAALKGVKGGAGGGGGSAGLGGGSASGSFASSAEGDPGNINLQMKPGDAWDFWTAMQNPAFANLIQFGGPASMGNVTQWSTTGTFGTPQELAALAAQQLQATISTQQALMKAYEDLKNHANATGTAVASLGTAAASAAATLADKLTKSYQDAFVALQDATAAYQAGTMSLVDYEKATQAYRDAQTALTDSTNLLNVPMQLLGTSGSHLASVWGNITSAANSTSDSLVIATDVVSTFAQQASMAAQTLATSVQGASDTITSASTSIATAAAVTAVVAQGAIATMFPMLGSQMNPATSVTGLPLPAQGVGGYQGPVLNINVNIPGTIVGPGGISGVTSAIKNELVSQLATAGIRLTRG